MELRTNDRHMPPLYQSATIALLASVSLLVPIREAQARKGYTPDPQRPPNIVIILADDLGYADAAFNPLHAKEVRTPHLEALAKEGVVCRQGYVTANVCSPSRAGLLMGCYQQRLEEPAFREAKMELTTDHPIFPGFLKDAGYISMHIGKWHLGAAGPLALGFSQSLGRNPQSIRKSDPATNNSQKPAQDERDSDLFGREASLFVHRHRDRPFFLYLAFTDVHDPLDAPAKEIARFHTGNPQRDTMLAMGKCMDDAIGQLVKQLKRDGTWENTLLIFLSDNGGALRSSADNSPLRGGKHQYFEGGIRVPFLVCWPGRLKPGVSDAVVSSLDILPTALAAAGIPVPTDRPLDGIDLLPILQGKGSVPSRDLFWSSGEKTGRWAVRSGDWKLVGDEGKTFLFDLAEDPSEQKDLAASMPQKAEELKGLHQLWLKQMPPQRAHLTRPDRQDPARTRPRRERPEKED